MTKRYVCALLLSTLISSCATLERSPRSNSAADGDGYVAPSKLNELRDSYDGQRVRVRGWMRSAFENYAIWDSEDSAKKGKFSTHCVALGIPDSMDTSGLDKKFVEMEGIFLKELPLGVIQLGACNYTVLNLDPDRPPMKASE